MAYLIPSDYLRTIQDVNLQQIITSNTAVQSGAELAAQAEAISYLRQKYIVTQEFTTTEQWSETSPYSARDRVYLNATAYATASTYNVGDYALQAGIVYRCNTNGTTGAFDTTKWDEKGAQYDIFSALLPFPEFDLYKFYVVGDKVFWKNKQYTCLIQTSSISHDTELQYNSLQSVPEANIFPDDVQEGAIYWKDDGAYLIDAGTDILNASVWAETDNRDQQMVMYFVDITLFHLHSRITPRNVPQLRIDRYSAAIDWLKMCARGEVTPNLPVIQPKQGRRIRYGGAVRNINTY